MKYFSLIRNMFGRFLFGNNVVVIVDENWRCYVFTSWGQVQVAEVHLGCGGVGHCLSLPIEDISHEQFARDEMNEWRNYVPDEREGAG